MKMIKSKNLWSNIAKQIETTYQYVEIHTEYHSKITLNSNTNNMIFKSNKTNP